MTPHVLYDQTEGRSPVVKHLSRLDCVTRPTRLPGGDYLLSKRLIVERKRSIDFAHGMVTGRTLGQPSRLALTYPLVLLIVEGVEWTADHRLRAPMIARLAHWATTSPGVSVIPTASPSMTARVIVEIARIEQHTRQEYQALPPLAPRAASTPGDILQALPGVGPIGAVKLLEAFGSLRGVLLADEAALRRVIGPKRGLRVHTILSS